MTASTQCSSHATENKSPAPVLATSGCTAVLPLEASEKELSFYGSL